MTGTERKVFQKYYPPDFDPSKIPRAKGRRNHQFVQRVMTPFNMQCNTCHEYIYKGKKFNMKRETAEGEFYLGLRIFRFYFKCPNCLAEITFKTDLEHCDYQMEHGATRLFEAFKLFQEAEKAKEAKEEEDKKDPMKMLEKRTKQSRAEMEAVAKLEELQEKNRMYEGVDVNNYLEKTDTKLTMADILRAQEQLDEQEISRLFGKTEDGKIIKRIKDEDDDESGGAAAGPSSLVKQELIEDVKPEIPTKPLPPTSSLASAREGKKRELDQKALLSKLIVIKKKKNEPQIKSEPPDPDVAGSSSSSCNAGASSSTQKSGSSLAGLAAYGSDSDSD